MTTDCGGGGESFHASVVPVEFSLRPAWPNPAVAATTIQFDVPTAFAGRPLDLAVFDVAGRRVASLRQEAAAVAGSFALEWSRRNDSGGLCARGVYFVRLSVGSDSRAVTLILR